MSGNISEVRMSEELRKLYNSINWTVQNVIKLEEFLKKLKDGVI